MSKISRRRFVGSAGAIATCSLLGHGCVSATQEQTTQSINYAVSTTSGLEVNKVRLGFVALTDAAPLIIAQEKGYFRKYGLTQVEVVRQASSTYLISIFPIFSSFFSFSSSLTFRV